MWANQAIDFKCKKDQQDKNIDPRPTKYKFSR